MIDIIVKFKKSGVVLMFVPKTKFGKPFTPKAITIRSDQADFIEKTSLNLSKFVQKQLDEIMGKKEGKKWN